MRGVSFALVAALGAAACSPAGPQMAAQEAKVEAAAPAGLAGEGGEASGRIMPQPAPQLAYEHQMRLVAPASAVSRLLNSHRDACAVHGAGRCQIITAASSIERGEARASLVLRAESGWLKAFRAGLADDLARAGGRIEEAATTSEDLTQQIIDVEARVLAQRTLRDRLQALLAGKPGKLAELLEVERELARVQAELDAAVSTLQVYRTRVATELLTITYRSAPSVAGANAWRPLTNALEGGAGVIAASLGVLITLIAAALPVAALLLPGAWLLRRFLRRRRTPQKTGS